MTARMNFELELEQLHNRLAEMGETAWYIGEVRKGSREVQIV